MNKKEFDLKLTSIELSFLSFAVHKQLEEVQSMYDEVVKSDTYDEIYISTLSMLKKIYEKINSCY